MPDALEQLRESYSRIAREYADHFGDELSHKPLDRALLDTVLGERPSGSTVADVGCGPGHVTRYLHDRGAPCVGVDVSPGMIEVARENNPGIDFVEGSLTDLPVADGSWGAIVALYSIIHLPPNARGIAFSELARALAPGGLLFVSFHVGDAVIHREELLGRPVTLDFHMLNTADVVALCERAGLTVQVTLERRPHLAIEAPTTRGYVLAGKESTIVTTMAPE
ncbi:MAG: methyltransferase domain-containing protein [Candidatus Dormibacteraeota bacterium]|nr:methyltransferase domain-containing protein [Candidatus Dormibacteraeota bacterium]